VCVPWVLVLVSEWKEEEAPVALTADAAVVAAAAAAADVAAVAGVAACCS